MPTIRGCEFAGLASGGKWIRTIGPTRRSQQNCGTFEPGAAGNVVPRTYFDDNLNAIPDLAESWEASADQKVWTFHLRHGVKFHDGHEFDAEDVLATYKRLSDPAIGS